MESGENSAKAGEINFDISRSSAFTTTSPSRMTFKGTSPHRLRHRLAPLRAGVLALILGLLALPGIAGAEVVKDIAVQYTGPKSVDEGRILANVSTKVGDTLDQAVIERDIKSLYDSGDVENVRMFTEPYSGGVRLIILVESRATLGRISFLGNSGIPEDKLRREVDLVVGGGFDDTKLEEARQVIADLYLKKGFSDATVTYKSTPAPEGDFSNVTFIIDEGDKNLLHEIEFVNVTVFEPKELEQAMKVKEKRIWRLFSKNNGKIDNFLLEEDIVSIEDKYKDAGYLNARVTGIERRRVDDKRVDLVITVEEGSQYDVASVALEGVTLFSQAELEGRLTQKGGTKYSGLQVKADIQMLKDYYGTQGYADMRVTPRITSAGGNVLNVEYSVFEGEKSTIGLININGNDRTKDHVIRRELAVHPGEEFDTVNLRASENRLKNLGYFEDPIETNVLETDVPNVKDISFTVKEKPTGTINFGAGFSSIDNLVGFVDLVQTNFDLFGWPRFTGAGQKFRASVKYGTERKDFVINVTEPWLFGQRLAFGVEGFFHEYRFLSDYYDQRDIGGEFSLRKPLGEHTYLRGFYRPQSLEVYDIASDASDQIRAEEGEYFQNLLGLTFTVDTRDNVYLPRRGYRVNVGGNYSFGDIEAPGFNIDGKTFYNGPLDTIFSLEGSFRTIDGDVPIVSREFLGGANNLRGFDYRDVGPRDDNGEPLGGNTAAFATAEVTVPIIEKVRVAFFGDVGTVSADSFDFGDVNSDVGIGLRLFLPIGQINLDYAIPIQSDEFNDSNGRFNFTIGADF